MPKLMGVADTVALQTISNFGFTAQRPDTLGASEYTIVNIAVDVSGSVSGFARDLEKAYRDVVGSCRKNPRAENLLLRGVRFNHDLSEIHGFQGLSTIDEANTTFSPSGGTALFDSALEGVESLGRYGKNLADMDYLVNGVLFIVTDGDDQGSRVGNPAKIKAAIEAVTMPAKFSSLGSVTDSDKLCKGLGIKLYTRPIIDDVELSIESFEKAFGRPPSRLTIENMQARIRGRVLMELSNDSGALVLSTGNKSEMSVGYCTIYGDMCGGLSVIADLYKMEVYAIAKYYNEQKGDHIVPKDTIEKAPSAELWEGQKDIDSLPPYPILDALLKLYLERDLMTREEIAECTALIEPMTLKEIKRVLKMVDGAEFKRRQAAPVLRVHRRAFGFGRNLPITQKYPVSYDNVL